MTSHERHADVPRRAIGPERMRMLGREHASSGTIACACGDHSVRTRLRSGMHEVLIACACWHRSMRTRPGSDGRAVA